MGGRNFIDLKFPCLCPLVLLLKYVGGKVDRWEMIVGCWSMQQEKQVECWRSIFNSFSFHQCKYAHDMCGYLPGMFTV
jgi:hypothetical protein